MLVMFCVAFFVPAVRAAYVSNAVLGSSLGILGGLIWLWRIAYQDDPQECYKSVAIPFYFLYYGLIHLPATAKPMATITIGVLLMVSVAFVSPGSRFTASDVEPEYAAVFERTAEARNQPFDLSQVPVRYPDFASQDNRPRSATLRTVFQFDSAQRDQELSEADPPPGAKMQMRLYLPPGIHGRTSLPCVLVAPAGTNLISGSHMDSGSSNPEHMPYIKAGFVVITFSLDGAIRNRETATDADYARAYRQFHAAMAGLVNARNAFEFALHSAPEIDPHRIYIAGHSSAGTLALLFAAHEQRLAGCIAYAPETDVAAFLGDVAGEVSSSDFPSLNEFLIRSSPQTHAARISCPVFVFHSTGDTVTPYSRSKRFCDELARLGKDVTHSAFDGRDHYQTMISPGIPRAIEWLQSGRVERGD